MSIINMHVYHGSDVIVKQPDLKHSVRALDFGTGFYTTTNEKQAIQFAHKVYERTLRRELVPQGYFVSVYSINHAMMQQHLSILTFQNPDENWFDFVMANRKSTYDGKPYDVIYGPVANDTVYRALLGYETGLYTKAQTIEQLAVRKLFNQITFATEKALSFLQFTEYREISSWKK